ncbi:hypothetical protein FQZ97_786260 [compost metagenome]
MGGFIADHPQRVQFLQHDVANHFLKGRIPELLEETIARLTGQAQIPVEHSNQHLRKTTQFDGRRVRVGKHIALCK